MPENTMKKWMLLAAVALCSTLFHTSLAHAQSPELSLREFASGQIKKGVRSIGFGGDGATWGNYALVYRDAGGALVDYGATEYTNGNSFTFTAVALTTPVVWHGMAFYVIALSQHADGINLALTSPGLGHNAQVHGSGSNQAVFAKVAVPLGHGFSVGALLSYELSLFDGVAPANGAAVHYATEWRPSGGVGITWQPHERLLFGARVVLNHDYEIRDDSAGRTQGLARSYEYRLGGSVSPWQGALIDVGGTFLQKWNAVNATYKTVIGPNIGFEQALFDRHLMLRAGVDETAYGAGITLLFSPVRLDVAYVYGLGRGRVGTLFGTTSNSVLATLTFDYGAFIASQRAVEEAPTH